LLSIVLSGYYGFNNAGDEAVLASLIQALQEEIPQGEITVLSQNPEQTIKQYGVKAVNRWQVKAIVPAVRKCDLFVSGGGSLLQDVTGAKSILYYLGLIRLAGFLGKKVMVYAQGIGPVKRSWARSLTARVLNKVDLITVRDDASRDDLALMGVTRPPVYVTADPVLGWERSRQEKGRDALCRAKAESSRCIGVSLRPWDGIKPEEIAGACDFLAEQGFQLVFFPFHFPGDIAVCREVSQLMEHESRLIKENLSPGEMMDAVGKMHLVIGMRLHALIMAAAQGVPFVPISYDPKVERFAAQMGQEVPCSVETLQCRNLTNFLEQILDKHSLIQQDLTKKAVEMKIRARKTAKMAAELINKGKLNAKWGKS